MISWYAQISSHSFFVDFRLNLLVKASIPSNDIIVWLVFGGESSTFIVGENWTCFEPICQIFRCLVFEDFLAIFDMFGTVFECFLDRGPGRLWSDAMDYTLRFFFLTIGSLVLLLLLLVLMARRCFDCLRCVLLNYRLWFASIDFLRVGNTLALLTYSSPK